MRFTGERDSSGHADRFWAAALCREAKGHHNGPTCPPFATDALTSYEDRTI